MSFDSRNNLVAALSMAERGWHVFPCHTILHGGCSCGKSCRSPAKHPMTPNGHNDAACDLAWIKAVWEDTPWANIGIRTGPESGIWVLDLDGEDGIQDLAKLEAENGPLPRTPTLKTGSGGRHLYFAWPAGLDIKNTTKILGMSIDVRGAGGYVIGAGSSNVEGSYGLGNQP
jgi:bifunctional DNA primase/polymerase-like protein